MKNIKIFLGLIFSLFIFLFAFSNNNAKANSSIAGNGDVNLNVEINDKSTLIRFVITSSGVELDEIDEIELILTKDGNKTKNPIYINKVYTSLSNAANDYIEMENTYYGILVLEDIKSISGAYITANCKITYIDESFITLDEDKSFYVPKINKYEFDGDHIYFGSYPQRKLEDNNIIDELNNMVGSPDNPNEDYEWISYEYYISNQKEDFMFYIDVDYDGDGINDYRGVYFNQYRPNAVDKTSTDGNTNQLENKYYINETYWFIYEPIKWDILSIEDGKALLSSSLIVDCQQYTFAGNLATTFPSSHNGYDYRYLSSYDASDLRIWFNDSFYNQAFDDNDKQIIELSEVDNSIDSVGSYLKTMIENSSTIEADALLGNNTNDYVYTLSYEELDTYYKNANNRKFSPTDYSLCQGFKYYDPTGSGDNWTRTPSQTLYEASYLTRSGNLNNGSSNYKKVVTYVDGVRPAITIDLDMYRLNLSKTEGGDINLPLENSFYYGEKIDLVATPQETYSFDGWYHNDKLLSSDNEFTFIMADKDFDIEARFNTYTLKTSIDDINAGTISEFDEAVSAGTKVNLSIELADGYSFLGWYLNDELLSENTSFNYTMTKENVNIVAKTTQYKLSVSYRLNNDIENSYLVRFDSRGGTKIRDKYSNCIVCPSAPTKEGYLFGGWYTDPECTNLFDFSDYVIEEDTILYAKWVEIEDNDAYVLPDGYKDHYIYNHQYSPYVQFVSTYTGNLRVRMYHSGQKNHVYVYLYDENKNVIKTIDNHSNQAFFDFEFETEAGKTYYINLYLDSQYGGYDGSRGFQCQVHYYSQSVVSKGYDYGSSTYYDNVATRNGTKVKLEATIKNDTSFVGWYINNELISSDRIYYYVMPKEDIRIEARFEYFTVNVINDSACGTVTEYNNKKVLLGSTVSLNASVNDGYSFVGWYSNNELLSNSPKYSFTMTDNIEIEARYQEININLTKNIDEAGLVSLSDNPVFNEEVSIIATVNYGYIFTGWYHNDELVSSDLEYSFILNGDASFEARYIISNISIDITYEDAAEISDYKFGYVLNQGLEVSLTYDSEYTWYGWYLNDEFLTIDLNITIDITNETKAYVARFEKYVLTISSNYVGDLPDYTMVSFDTNGGNNLEPQKSSELEFVIPSKANCLFMGWYKDPELTEYYDFDEEIKDNMTLYAKWYQLKEKESILNVNSSTSVQMSGNGYDDYGLKYAFMAYKDETVKFEVYLSTNYNYYSVFVYDEEYNKVGDFHNLHHGDINNLEFEVEKGKVYYLAADYHVMGTPKLPTTFTCSIPKSINKTTRNNTIVKYNDNVNIISNDIVGYTFDGWYLNDTLITHNKNYVFVMPESNIAYEARYIKNTVSYTVNHYLQNADNDLYEIESAETLYGLVDELTEASPNSYTGFVNKEFEQLNINGDSSTVINIYYDRINYDLDVEVINVINNTNPGSVNITSQSFRYDKEITLTASVNTGYEFVGYYDNNDLLLCQNSEYKFNMPSNDLQIVAKYSSLLVDYTVKYNLENILDDNYTTEDEVTLQGYTGNLTNAELVEYDYCNTPTIKQLQISGDGSTIVNINYSRKTINRIELSINGDRNENNALYGSIERIDDFILLEQHNSNPDVTIYYQYQRYTKCGREITPELTLEDGYMLEGWYLNGVRIDGSENQFTYIVNDLDTDSDGEIKLVARLKFRYILEYSYQNNINEFLSGEDPERGFTADLDSLEERWANQFSILTLTEESLGNVKEGYDFYQAEDYTINETDIIVVAYCVPRLQSVTFERNSGYHIFAWYDFATGDYHYEGGSIYTGQRIKVYTDKNDAQSQLDGFYLITTGGEIKLETLENDNEYYAIVTMVPVDCIIVCRFYITVTYEYYFNGVKNDTYTQNVNLTCNSYFGATEEEMNQFNDLGYTFDKSIVYDGETEKVVNDSKTAYYFISVPDNGNIIFRLYYTN